MAAVLGNVVVAAVFVSVSNQLAALSPFGGGGGMPLKGLVTIVSGANFTVDWEDGTQTVSADTGAQLAPLAAPTSAATDLYHRKVQLLPGTGVPNVYGSTTGIVVAALNMSGTDYLFVRLESGVVIYGVVGAFQLVPTNTNVD